MKGRLFGVRVEVAVPALDAAVQGLFALGASGVQEIDVERGVRLLTYVEDAHAAARLASGLQHLLGDECLGPASVEVFEAPAGDWESRWLEDLGPTPITQSAVIIPVEPGAAPRSVQRDSRGRALLRLVKRVAFGFGEHLTTHIAARALEAECRSRAGARVLDVGAGTGVLAMVALCAGAARATACEIEPRAVAAARENAELNLLSERMAVVEGGVEHIEGCFDVVVANLEGRTQLVLARALAARVAPDGVLLLTGFSLDGADEVEQALSRLHLSVDREQTEGSSVPEPAEQWCLLRATPSRVPQVATGR